MLLKLADESWTGIRKLPKELSDLASGGGNKFKKPSDGSVGEINGGGGGNPRPWPRSGGSVGGDGGGKDYYCLWFLSVS